MVELVYTLDLESSFFKELRVQVPFLVNSYIIFFLRFLLLLNLTKNNSLLKLRFYLIKIKTEKNKIIFF